MPDQSQAHNEASDSNAGTPVASSANRSSADIARLENELMPSPPASEDGHSQAIRPATANVSLTNVDGSARVYRFPNDVPPRFGGASADPDPNERIVTVSDLRSKSCWICSDDDEDPLPEQSQSTSTGSFPTGPSRPRRFVHPCNCTLVAHESCLLRWIQQSKRDKPRKGYVSCPQCKAPYILINNKSTLLKMFEFFDKLLTSVEPIGALALLGGSVLVSCTAYGCVAIRMFLGKDAAQRALASPWPWHYWFDIPLIPFALIASRLHIFDSAMTWVPTIVAFPITSIPLATATAAHGRLFTHYLESSVFNVRAYPPGPALTALLIPWFRVFYLGLKRRIYRYVLGPFYGIRQGGVSTRTANERRRRRRRRRVIVFGNPDRYLGDNDAALDGFGDPMAPVRGDQQAGHAGGDGGAETVYVSHHSFVRLCLGALSLPFVANLTGHLLARLARHSPLLARFLGINNIHPSSSTSILQSFYTTKTTPITPNKTSSSSASPSPIASLFRGRLSVLDNEVRDPKAGHAVDANRPFAERLALLGYSSQYDDLDPVWFRNAVGAGLYILIKDAASLLYRYLRLSQRSKISIKDLPFQAGLVSGLELRD